jgi:hypothetical protein
MPEWIHSRARHIEAKNPEMPESEAFAIATQQSHAVGKSPKGYGTTKGRHQAKKKYTTPSDDKKTADPGGIGKEAAELNHLGPFVASFVDEIEKIAQMSAGQSDVANPAQIGVIKSTAPKDLSKPGQVPKYSTVNSGTSMSPIAQHQSVLAAPPVRT